VTGEYPDPSSGSADAYADQEARYGIVPLLAADRIYSLPDLVFVAGSYAIATWCFFQGAALATQQSFPQALLSTFGVCLSFVVLICLIGVMANKYGIDHWISSRAVWGHRGTPILLLTMLAATWGWGAINAQMFGESLLKLATGAGVASESPWTVKLLALACVAMGFGVALRGANAVRLAARIMGLLLLGVGALVVVLVIGSDNFLTAWRQGPLAPPAAGMNPRTSYMLGTEWNVAFVLAWFPVIGALTRLGRTQRAAHWGLWAGYGVMMASFIFIGVAVAHVSAAGGGAADGDPTGYLLTLGGPWLGSLTLVLVGVANISTTAVGLYGTAISTKILYPTRRYEHVCGFWALFVAALTLWGGVWTYYQVFLAVMGIINGPAVGLLLADYWVIRRRRINLRGLFEPGVYWYTGGINLVALAAFAAGVIAFLLVYDPVRVIVHRALPFNTFTATGFATLVAAAMYVMCAAVPLVRGYLLRDRASGPESVC
jgi:NCS1 family nucleobase:cation symporter-1